MKQEDASIIALQAMAYVASDPEIMTGFLESAGMDPDDLKTRMHEPDLQGGILDLVLSDDRILLNFCNVHTYTPQDVMMARKALPGGLQLG